MTAPAPTLTPEALAELRRLYDAATPGPWETAQLRFVTDIRSPHANDEIAEVHKAADADFIVAAVNALPTLLAAYDAQAAELAEARDGLGAMRAELAAVDAERSGLLERLQARGAEPEAAKRWEAVELAEVRAANPSTWPDLERERNAAREERDKARGELAAIVALGKLPPGAPAPEHPGEAYAWVVGRLEYERQIRATLLEIKNRARISRKRALLYAVSVRRKRDTARARVAELEAENERLRASAAAWRERGSW